MSRSPSEGPDRSLPCQPLPRGHRSGEGGIEGHIGTHPARPPLCTMRGSGHQSGEQTVCWRNYKLLSLKTSLSTKCAVILCQETFCPKKQKGVTTITTVTISQAGHSCLGACSPHNKGTGGVGGAVTLSPQPSPPQPGPGSPRDTRPSRRKGCARQGAGCHQPELSCPRWAGGQGVEAAPSASDPRQCGAAQRRGPRPGPVRPCGRALPSERALPPRPSDARQGGDSQPEGAAGSWAATRRLSEPRQPRDLCEGLSISSRPADGAGRGVQPPSRKAAGPL